MQTPDTDPNPEKTFQPMDTTSDELGGGEWIDSPVDDLTYDLLMALASKLEAIDTYQVYAEDGQPELWRELATEERRQAERLLNELKQRFAAS